MFGHIRRRKSAFPRCSAVVPAAGSATRMEGLDKVLVDLGGCPVLVRTLRALTDCPYITEIIVVTREDLIVPVSRLCRDFGLDKVTHVVVGGETRTQSVLHGLREVDPEVPLVAIHDGARPFVTQEVLAAAIERAAQCGAAAPAIPVTDTVKRAHDGLVEATLDRDTLFAVQTPQVFDTSLIKAALTQALESGAAITDDCAAVERLGMTVALTPGDRTNLKLTTPADLDLGLGILNGRGELV